MNLIFGYLSLINASSRVGCRITWTDPADTDYEGVEFVFEKVADGSTETVFVPAGQESRCLETLLKGEEYNLTVRTRDITGNYSAADTVTLSLSSQNIVTVDLDVETGLKETEYQYDYTVTDEIRIISYLDNDSDGVFSDVGDCKLLYTFNPDMTLSEMASYWDVSFTDVDFKFRFIYDSECRITRICLDYDLDEDDTPGNTPGDEDTVIYDFTYQDGVLYSMDQHFNSALSSPALHHRYLFITNTEGQPTQAFLYADASDGVLDANPSYRFDYSYSGDLISQVDRYEDEDLDGAFINDRKKVFAYDAVWENMISTFEEYDSAEALIVRAVFNY